MSYRLHLLPNDPDLQVGPDARELLARIPNFGDARLYDGGDWDVLYENPLTGVTCAFRWRTRDDGARVLSFELDTVRPLFFAIEALPYVSLLAADLGLRVVEPPTGRTIVPDVASLLSSWRDANESDVRAARARGADLNYLPESNAMEWWRYMGARPELELSVPEGVFVPSIMIVRTGDGELQRIVVWPDAIPQLLPPCEYLLMSRGRTGLADDDREIGAVPYADLLKALDGQVRRFDAGTMSIPMVDSDTPEVTRVFANIELRDLNPAEVRIIAPSQYHTVEGV